MSPSAKDDNFDTLTKVWAWVKVLQDSTTLTMSSGDRVSKPTVSNSLDAVRRRMQRLLSGESMLT